MQKRTFVYSFKSTLPIMAGYIFLGIGYGIIMQSNGYGVLWVIASGLFIYAGAMQFVTVSLLTQGASLFTAAVMTVLVNMRHIFYSLSMLTQYRRKPYLIFTLTDETFSLVCRSDIPDCIDIQKYYFYVSLLDQIWWVTGGVIGSMLGNVIPFSMEGIDFAMTCLFVVMLTEQWENTKEHKSAVTGILGTLASLLLFGSDNFLIPAMAVIVTVLLFSGKKLLNEDKKNA